MVQQLHPEPTQEPVRGEQVRPESSSVVAIVGRPNVGKSSLFNRILARRQAIVSEVAGTTRDRLMSEVEWDDYRFILVDTGGLETDPQGPIRELVQEQADMAMSDADLIIFLTDVVEGLTPNDQLFAERLRRTHKPVILAVNKVDNDNRELAAAEFYRLGLTPTVLISAYHNYGIYDLMEQVTSHLTPQPLPEENAEPPVSDLKLSIVGRTNVGKSLLLNAVLGEERAIVSEVAGTTRDALDTPFIYEENPITLIDTAGIRRPGRVQRGIEKYSVLRAVNAVNRSDITLLVTDASELATAQDAHIAGLAWEMYRGLIVVVNKWDLVPEDERYAVGRAVRRIQRRLHFMSHVPICFVSALQRQGIDILMQMALNLWAERKRWISDTQLQYLLARALTDHPPPTPTAHRSHQIRIGRLRQVDINPPTFLFTTTRPDLVHFSYKRYLENQIREAFGFEQSHLRLVFKKK